LPAARFALSNSNAAFLASRAFSAVGAAAETMLR